MKVFMGVMLLIVSMGLKAETEIFYAWKSHHWVTENYTNDTHHMFGLRVDNIVAGTFNNSYDRQSYFVGLYGEKEFKKVEFFGVIGAVRGYTKCLGDDNTGVDTCPMVVFGVSYLGDYVKPTLFQLGDASVIGLRFEF